MAGITLAQAEAQLAAWIDASTKTAAGQRISMTSGGFTRDLTRADAAEIRQQIDYWDRKVKDLTPVAAGGRRRTRYVVHE